MSGGGYVFADEAELLPPPLSGADAFTMEALKERKQRLSGSPRTGSPLLPPGHPPFPYGSPRGESPSSHSHSPRRVSLTANPLPPVGSPRIPQSPSQSSRGSEGVGHRFSLGTDAGPMAAWSTYQFDRRVKVKEGYTKPLFRDGDEGWAIKTSPVTANTLVVFDGASEAITVGAGYLMDIPFFDPDSPIHRREEEEEEEEGEEGEEGEEQGDDGELLFQARTMVEAPEPVWRVYEMMKKMASRFEQLSVSSKCPVCEKWDMGRFVGRLCEICMTLLRDEEGYPYRIMPPGQGVDDGPKYFHCISLGTDKMVDESGTMYVKGIPAGISTIWVDGVAEPMVYLREPAPFDLTPEFMFHLCDLSMDGEVNFHELSHAVTLFGRSLSAEEVWDLLSLFDVNGNGVLNLDEVVDRPEFVANLVSPETAASLASAVARRRAGYFVGFDEAIGGEHRYANKFEPDLP